MTPETPETDSTLAVKGLQPELSVKAHAGSGKGFMVIIWVASPMPHSLLYEIVIKYVPGLKKVSIGSPILFTPLWVHPVVGVIATLSN